MHRRSHLISVITVLALCPIPAGGQGGVDLLGYHATPPAAWMPRKPSSSSRLAQFVTPAADSAKRAEVVVFFFGATQGGNVDANLTRWRGQFSVDGAKPEFERVTRDSAGAIPLTIAEFRGTYQRGIGAGSADSVHTGQTLVAIIAETPRGALFFQLFGPSATVASARDAFVQFAKSLK